LLATLPNPLIHVEDGFLRSVGLGADLIQPVSWVMDQRGIYFDASQPSDLEHLLEHTEFTSDVLVRAKALRSQIVALGLTKYNVGVGQWQRPDTAAAVVLVAGQVESDASIQYGAGEIRRNMDLLRAVRAELPDAYLVYKPHPDVVAGLRAKGESEDSARQWCDEVLIDAPMSDLLGKVDAVHVLTSLTGFEALLRGISVTCWGMPFYAGWGLTSDRIHCHRRSRARTLDELVSATLLLYPAYRSRTSGRFTTPEQVLTELLDWKSQPVRELPIWRKIKRFVYGLFK
jgi:capsular polysaccharide export protein